MNLPPVSILVVDDQIDGHEMLLRELGRRDRVTAKFRLPDDIRDEDLQQASLILVDYDLSHWGAADANQPPARRISDGLALASCLRQTLHRHDGRPATAIVLYTAELQRLSSPEPPTRREHLLARAHNLEWVLSKSASDRADRAVSLARAVASLPPDWPDVAANQQATLLRLLGVPEGVRSGARVYEVVFRAGPPLADLAQWSDGLAVVRWLLQRIIPYPTFLIDHVHLAARLRVEPSWLAGLPEASDPFASARYDGLLAGFDGPRWWRAGVDQILWDETNGQGFQADAVRAWLESQTDVSPMFTNFKDPVVVLDDQNGATVVEAALAEQAHIDDWPEHADPPWVLREIQSGDGPP